MTWDPWKFTSSFIPYTPILAEEVNKEFNGIAVNLQSLSDTFGELDEQLSSSFVQLPAGFEGSATFPAGDVASTFMAIDAAGNVTLVPASELQRKDENNFDVINNDNQLISVSGADDNKWININGVHAAGIQVNIGPPTAAKQVIVFTQDTDSTVNFVQQGAQIKSPGELSPFGKYSTVTLVSMNTSTWIMGGDLAPKGSV